MNEMTLSSSTVHRVRRSVGVCQLPAVSVWAWCLASALPAFASGPPRIIIGPYLQHVTQTSITIMWETDRPCASAVRFGRARFLPRPQRNKPKPPIPLDRQMVSDRKDTLHEFVLTGLQPQTNYFYQVSSVDGSGQRVQSEVLSFQTAVRRDSPFAFVVIGDTRTYPRRFRKLVERIWQERPNFVLHVGDVVSDGTVRKQWIDEYLAPAAQLMQRVPLYVAIGNHERNAEWFYRYSAYPKPENYYSFDYGNAHFTIIDSNADLSPGSRQYKWLVRDLATTQATWKFVAHHHPPFSSDRDDYGDTYRGLSQRGDLKVRRLVPIYEKYGVDVVWCGHIHTYERTWPIRNGKVDQQNGVVYIQTGGGGAELEDFAPTRSWFTAKLLRNWQYCLVTIHGGTFRMMAYDIDGKMYDYLELRK